MFENDTNLGPIPLSPVKLDKNVSVIKLVAITYITDVKSLSTAAWVMANGDIIQARESFRVQEGIQETQGR